MSERNYNKQVAKRQRIGETTLVVGVGKLSTEARRTKEVR